MEPRLYSLKHQDVGLAVQLMHEINEAKSLAYKALLAGQAADVESYDASIARKLTQCAALGFPLHQHRETIVNGRNLCDYSPDGWRYIIEAPHQR